MCGHSSCSHAIQTALAQLAQPWEAAATAPEQLAIWLSTGIRAPGTYIYEYGDIDLRAAAALLIGLQRYTYSPAQTALTRRVKGHSDCNRFD